MAALSRRSPERAFARVPVRSSSLTAIRLPVHASCPVGEPLFAAGLLKASWIQAVAATNVDGSESSRSSSSAGVRQPNRLRGRALSSAATWSSQPGP